MNWLYLVLLLFVSSPLLFNLLRPITVLPRIALSPGYALQNAQGQPVTSEGQRGKFTLYTFSHTGCNLDCPQSGTSIDRLRGELSQRIDKSVPLQIVTLSVNPQQDSPERLRAFNQQFPQDPSIPWTWLTGDPLRMKYVIGGGFHVYYEGESEENSLYFEPRHVLVDDWGIIRAEYRTATPDPDLIARDVGLLMEEAEHREGAARLGYEAAHLFLCYPR